MVTGIITKVALAIIAVISLVYVVNFYHGQDIMPPSPLLVRDVEDGSPLPKRFRTMQDVIPDTAIATSGLEKLHASGSGAFSAQQLTEMKNKLGGKHITVVDLRQESHGFINGEGISWYGIANAANKGKPLEVIIQDETALLDGIRAAESIEVAEIADKEDGIIKEYTQIPVQVEKVQSEAELAEALGMGYQRIAVRDHAAPEPEMVDAYIKLVRDLPENSWLHLHCRGGKGRTTTFLALYDMMENAKSVELDTIIARQHALGGSFLFKKDVDKYKRDDALARKVFLENFYRYARENDDGFTTLWTDWLKQTHGKQGA